MITLITGQPGDGKTLYTIAMVRDLAEKSKREVYYSGIADLKLPWIELQAADEWYKCPPGAMIVIDEAQRIFRPRGNGSAVPKHVSELETHRHKGHDLFIITQQPGLCDTNVRKLVGRHFHCKRKFGTQNSTVHEWSQVQPNPDQQRKDSIRHDFMFPKDLYGIYKSAEVHTHKARIPMRFWMLILMPFVVAGLLYYAFSTLMGRTADPLPDSLKQQAGLGGLGEPGTASNRQRSSGAVTTAEYIASFKPRIPDLPHTAPRYDEASAVVNVPYPAACIEMRGRCQCYTEQATILSVSPYLCREIVRKGYFVEFAVNRPESRRQRSEEVDRPSLPPPAEQDSFSIPGYVEVRRDAAPLQERSGEQRAPDLPVFDRTRPNVPVFTPGG